MKYIKNYFTLYYNILMTAYKTKDKAVKTARPEPPSKTEGEL